MNKMRDIKQLTSYELADTTSSDVAGSAVAATTLQPVEWLKQIVDAAQKRLLFTQAVRVEDVPKGVKDLVIPKRDLFLLQGAGITDTLTEGTDVAFTTIDNLDGVTFTPVDHRTGVAISNRALRVNLLPLVQAARDELTYNAGDVVDIEVRDAIENATLGSDILNGAQLLFGGGKGGVDLLTASDIISVDMISDAKMRLMSKQQRFFSAGVETVATMTEKNPWMGDFWLFIAPEQENVFLKDPQFINAAEYGSDRVIKEGEIGEYLTVKIVVTNNVRRYTATETDATTSVAWGPAGFSCPMVKKDVCAGLAIGQRPKLHIFDFPSQLETRIILEQAYDAQTIHDDAIILLKVAE